MVARPLSNPKVPGSNPGWALLKFALQSRISNYVYFEHLDHLERPRNLIFYHKISYFYCLGSVAGSVIQATGRTDFEDGSRTGTKLEVRNGLQSVRTIPGAGYDPRGGVGA